MNFKAMRDASLKGMETLGDSELGGKALGMAKGFATVPGVLGAGNMFFDVSNQVKNGNGLGSSILKAGVETVLWEANPILMGAATLAPMAVQGGIAAHQFRKRKAQERYDMKHNSYGSIGGGFVDTMQAQTMRQAAVQQIQGNKLNARSALGGEARIFSNQIY